MLSYIASNSRATSRQQAAKSETRNDTLRTARTPSVSAGLIGARTCAASHGSPAPLARTIDGAHLRRQESRSSPKARVEDSTWSTLLTLDISNELHYYSHQ